MNPGECSSERNEREVWVKALAYDYDFCDMDKKVEQRSIVRIVDSGGRWHRYGRFFADDVIIKEDE